MLSTMRQMARAVREACGGDPVEKNSAKLGTVRLISGCDDKQKSQDVSLVSKFHLPNYDGPSGAGGAATNAFIASQPDESKTWVDILEAMRMHLETRKYTQIPQLSSTQSLDVQHEKFGLVNPAETPSSRKRAVLIGINYVGDKGELKGCHNDVDAVQNFIRKHGFADADIKVLKDDGKAISPTRKNIIDALKWLVDGAGPTDSLFLHFSGHGSYLKDWNSDEGDKQDEALVPLDYAMGNFIVDDELYEILVSPLPVGCYLTCINDSCHSGSSLDLHYSVRDDGKVPLNSIKMQRNPLFNILKRT